MRLAEPVGRGELEVVVDVPLIGAFVGDDDDARVHRLLQHRLQHLGVVRHDADRVDPLRDQVLDRADLERGIGARRADHEGVDAERLALFLDAHLHRVEPGDAPDLDHHAHARLVLRHGRRAEQNGADRNARQQCPDHVPTSLRPCRADAADCAGHLARPEAQSVVQQPMQASAQVKPVARGRP